MRPYPKIPTVFRRDPATRYTTVCEGEWATPELEYLRFTDWRFTEKVDGLHLRIHWDAETQTVQYAGRTDRSQIPAFLLSQLQRDFPVFRFHQAHLSTCTLYSEGYGAKIQKDGEEYLPDRCGCILFDVWMHGMWLRWDEVHAMSDTLAMSVVPDIGHGTLWDGITLVREGVLSQLRRSPAEGLVLRPMVDLTDRLGHRILTKIKGKDFSKEDRL